MGDRILESECRCRDDRVGVGGDVGQLETDLRVRRGRVGDGADAHGALERAELAHGVLGRADDDCGGTVGGRTDVEQTQRIGNDRRSGEVVERELLAEAGVLVADAGLGVLDLHHGEVFGGVTEDIDAATRIECEERRVRGAEQMEALPIGIFLALATDRSEETLGSRVGTDDHGDVGETGEDLGPSRLQGLSTGCARRVGRGDLGTGPAHRLRERGTGHETGVTVADGVGAGNELDVAPGDIGFGKGGLGGDKSVFDEVAAPLAPRVHSGTEYYKIAIGTHHALASGALGAHVQIQ